MALRKPITLSSGVAVEYHRITEIVYNRLTGQIQAVVDGYVDQAHAEGAAQPVAGARSVVTLTPEESALVIAALHEQAGSLIYPALKLTPEFSAAVDV